MQPSSARFGSIQNETGSKWPKKSISFKLSTNFSHGHWWDTGKRFVFLPTGWIFCMAPPSPFWPILSHHEMTWHTFSTYKNLTKNHFVTLVFNEVALLGVFSAKLLPRAYFFALWDFSTQNLDYNRHFRHVRVRYFYFSKLTKFGIGIG